MSDISQLTLPNGDSYDLKDSIARGNMNHIAYGQVDSTSTSTSFTATVEGITELKDGMCVMLRNGIVTSAADFTININGLGALPVYNNMATGNAITPTAPTRDTTIFNINYTMLFIYVESDIVEGGCWICYRGYNSDNNTVGYQLRTNSATHLAADKGYRYRIWLTSADGTKWVPINTSTSTNSTTARTLNTRKIDPFGPIVYRSANSTQNASEALGATGIWQQYNLVIGYSYVLSLTANLPVYLKCTPQSDGSASMSVLTQTLPSTNDGYIYIFLGIAYDATHMELRAEHPIYWHDGTGIRIWTGVTLPTKTSDLTNDSGFITDAGVTSFNGSTGAITYTAPVTSVNGATGAVTVSVPSASTTAPSMDGTASYGSGTDYARANHVHPTDTSRQATLVSGTNIKTIGNQSLLGSGNLTVANIGAATLSHVHGDITNGGDITATAPTITSGDKLIINDESASKITNGPAFGTSTSTFLRNDGTWAEPSNGASFSTTTCSLGTTGWSNNSITVNCAGVTASNDVVVTSAPASAADYAAAGIVCTAQSAGTLTFTRTSANSNSITVNVMIFQNSTSNASGVSF